MTKSKIKKNAIWWAVDPFHDDETFHNHAIKVLIPFARALSTLVFSPTCSTNSTLRRVIFPTDFSYESFITFGMLQKFFIKLKAPLSIVHGRELVSAKSISNPEMQAELASQERQNARTGQKMVSKARRGGLLVDLVMNTESDLESPSESILSYSRDKKADLIALASQSGPLTTVLLGAMSRTIVRDAHCPVLVYRVPPP